MWADIFITGVVGFGCYILGIMNGWRMRENPMLVKWVQKRNGEADDDE